VNSATKKNNWDTFRFHHVLNSVYCIDLNFGNELLRNSIVWNITFVSQTIWI
jgi:hypothetical protein